MSGPNAAPCELTGIRSIWQSLTNVDDEEWGKMAEDMLEADVMERATARLHSTLPINKFPREIIAELFWNCLVHEPQETVWMSSDNAPLLLCRVCSSWRAHALAIPQLWASIGILIRHQKDIDPSRCAYITNTATWLERSGILPLTITIDFAGYYAPTTILDAILSVIGPHSSRWQNVSITTLVPMSFPRLETLPLLRAFQVFSYAEQNAISLPFSGSPRLTRLAWPYLLDAPTDPQIPWSQISHLCLNKIMTFFAALETICSCPQLEEFTMELIAGNPWDRHPTIVKHHRLRTLVITCPADCSPFFNSLILPELRDFSLMGTRSGDASGHRAFLDLLTRSSCKLYKLELGNCAFGPLIECLEHKSFKYIKELRIDNLPWFTDNELIRLTDFPSPPAPPVLLPKLTHLILEWCLDASRGTLAEMVLSRRRQRDGREAEPLQYLFVFSDEFYKEDAVSINVEAKDGFKADIEVTFFLNENGERI
jgi:hypothetical protein